MAWRIVEALLAPFLMIAVGFALRRTAFLSQAFWPQAERLCYFVLLPSLFLHGLATAKLDGVPVFALAGTLVVSILLVAALVVALRPRLAIDGPGFTSLFQGAVRFNNYVGVSLAISMFGAQGLALAALCNAAIVPTVNVLCVLVFARFGHVRMSGRGVVRQLAVNPLILSCLLGVAIHALSIPLPPGVEPTLRAFGSASLPLGLLCVGAALEFGSARAWLKPIAASSVVKFALMPLVTALIAKGFGLTGQALTTALLFQALPTASSAYILSRQLGGDAPLMAGITAAQTVIAFAAMPAVVALLLAFVG